MKKTDFLLQCKLMEKQYWTKISTTNIPEQNYAAVTLIKGDFRLYCTLYDETAFYQLIYEANPHKKVVIIKEMPIEHEQLEVLMKKIIENDPNQEEREN